MFLVVARVSIVKRNHTNGKPLCGPVREYFPKSTDFTIISDGEVLRVEALLNNPLAPH